MIGPPQRPGGRQRLALRRGGISRRGGEPRVVATGHRRVLCSQGVHPHWRRQLETFSRGSGNQIDTVPLVGRRHRLGRRSSTRGRSGRSWSPLPNYLGCLEDIAAARAVADRFGARLVVCFDPVSAGLLRTPGSLGADVAVGEGQPFGTALGFGGPVPRLVRVPSQDVRRIPGRIVGETVDREGRHAYVMTFGRASRTSAANGRPRTCARTRP